MRELFSFVLFALAVYGLANAVAVLKIGRFFFGTGYCDEDGCPMPGHPLDKRRFLGRIPYLGDLFYCPPCIAFWIGMLGSWLVMSPAALYVVTSWKAMIVDGLAVSAVAWLLFTWTERNTASAEHDGAMAKKAGGKSI